MQTKKSAVISVLIILTAVTAVFAQEKKAFSPRAIGFQLAGTRRDAAQFSGSGMGLGGQISLEMNLKGNFSLLAGAGILTATDDFFATNTEKIVLLPSLEAVLKYTLMRGQVFEPYVFAGLGMINPTFKQEAGGVTTSSNQDLEGCFIGGGGFDYTLNDAGTRFFISGEYRNSVFSSVDPKPIYWVLKTGVSLNLDRPEQAESASWDDDDLSGIFAAEESGSLEEMNNSENYLESRVSSLETNVQENYERISALDNIIASHDEKISQLSDASARAGVRDVPVRQQAGISGSYAARYRRALDIYRQADYRTARDIFLSLLDENPHHHLADNCRYWVGECLHALGEYEEAIIMFDQVLLSKTSHKLDDSLLMKGQCFQLLGRTQEAADTFRDLLRRFPDSEYADRASYYLNNEQ